MDDIVSPGFGKFSKLYVVSTFTLPITKIDINFSSNLRILR